MNLCPSTLSSSYFHISTDLSRVFPPKEKTYKRVTVIKNFHIAVKNVQCNCVIEIPIGTNFSANMNRFILLVFIGALLMKNVTSLIQAYPTNLAWLFGSNDELNENKETTRNVCKSKECENIGKIISESMDIFADPCYDFYEYACGKWSEHNPIPEGKRKWSLLHMLQQKVEQQVDDILKEGAKKSDLLAVKLAKKWYTVCMNTDAMDKQGLDPLIITLSRIGGWPMIMDPDEWNEQEYSWQKVDDQYVRLTGINSFHDIRVNSYLPSKTVQVDVPHLPSGTYKLWLSKWYESDEIEDDDEDPSNEEKQSREDNQDNEGSGSGDDEDDDDDEDDEGDNSEDIYVDNEDRGDNTNKHSKDRKKKIAKKEINKKKSMDNKLTQNKNFKIQHNKKTQSNTRILNSHKTKQRVKRRAIPTKIHSKHAQHLTHHEKLRKSKKNHVRKAQVEKKTRETLRALSTTTIPQITTEETSDEDDMDGISVQRYANYILEVARVIAKDTEISEEYIKKDIEDLIAFQVKLAIIAMNSGGEDLELTLDDFQQWYDERKPDTVNRNVSLKPDTLNSNAQINWMYKIAELFDEAHVPVDGELSLNVDQPDYFKALAVLLDETPSRTIVNYIHWNFLSVMIETTTTEMRELYNAWEEWDEEDKEDEQDEEGDENEEKNRSYNCRREEQLHDILAYEYVKRHFLDDITQTAKDMVDDIQKEVEYQIKESDWLDKDIKDYVFAKLVNMKKYIGYPDWYRNNTIVKRYFQGLIISNSYYENILSFSRYNKWKQLRELKKDDDEDDDVWWMNPLTVNAFFSPWANSISLSVADFQSPFFAYDRPQAINYGIVGVIMAHEVNHGFDDYGMFFDKNGNGVNDDNDFVEWLSIMSREYGKRANCFVEQFNNYPIGKNSTTQISHYGNQTSGENIADTMGLQASYRAYQRRERECGKPDVVLPCLEEVTNDQLFFLSFANLLCEATDPEAIAWMDEHSTGRLRVIGSVSNSEDFARAYNCPVGSKMNPERKCNIWK